MWRADRYAQGMECTANRSEKDESAIYWFMTNVSKYPSNPMTTERSSMSRSLYKNRDLEKLEPYEGKLSRTVLREQGSNALDLPDRPSDLQQRDGRGVRSRKSDC